MQRQKHAIVSTYLHRALQIYCYITLCAYMLGCFIKCVNVLAHGPNPGCHCFLIKCFILQIIIDLYAVIKIIQGDPVYRFTQSLPVVTHCKTAIEYHNQDIDVSIIKVENTTITPRNFCVVLVLARSSSFPPLPTL